MKTHQKYIFSLLAATAILGAGSAQADPILIDRFTEEQDVGLIGIDDFIPDSSQVGTEDIIGDYRDIAVMGNADNFLETRVTVENGVLSFSNNTGTTGSAMIVWDGDDDDATVVDTDGLGGIDLTGGAWELDRILLEIISADLDGLELEFTIYDLDGGVSYLSRDFLAIDDPVTEAFLFDNFNDVTPGGADFTNVGAIKLNIDGPAEIDARFDMIEVGKEPRRRVPEPLTSFWTFAGISALAGLSRKKKVGSRN